MRHLYRWIQLLATAAVAEAHGYVDSPPVRQAGRATAVACGATVEREIARDNSSHVEGLPELAAKDSGYNQTTCNLWLCRGIQYADNIDGVQRYAPGQVVEMKVKLIIPHIGTANVSVVDTPTNRIIGDMLKFWSSGYADAAAFYQKSLPLNNTDFNVTLPDVTDKCSVPGQCVLQWWWYATGANQNYESCVDFYMP